MGAGFPSCGVGGVRHSGLRMGGGVHHTGRGGCGLKSLGDFALRIGTQGFGVSESCLVGDLRYR
jgi:hypothetical protein